MRARSQRYAFHCWVRHPDRNSGSSAGSTVKDSFACLLSVLVLYTVKKLLKHIFVLLFHYCSRLFPKHAFVCICISAPLRYSTPGGYSSKAVRPIALAKVMALATMIRSDPAFKDKTLSGIGGVETGENAAEFLLVGADTVQASRTVRAGQYCTVRYSTVQYNTGPRCRGFEGVKIMYRQVEWTSQCCISKHLLSLITHPLLFIPLG